jgi:iron complex outermembrane receptor protein
MLVLKASIARNYRYPSMDDLYFKPGGNPNLRPEKGFTYDGGLEFSVQRKRYTLKGNLSAFDSHITDWILWTPNAKGYWQPSNLKKVHNYGTEMMASAELRMKHQWRLTLTGNYAYTPSINKSEHVDGNDASYDKQLVYVPRHSANLSGGLSWRTWTLRYQWTHYSERFTTTSNEVSYITGRLKPYYMNDISLEKTFQWRHFHASVKAVVNNLFDSEYVTVLSRPMAGRNFEIFLELKPKWK